MDTHEDSLCSSSPPQSPARPFLISVIAALEARHVLGLDLGHSLESMFLANTISTSHQKRFLLGRAGRRFSTYPICG